MKLTGMMSRFSIGGRGGFDGLNQSHTAVLQPAPSISVIKVKSILK